MKKNKITIEEINKLLESLPKSIDDKIRRRRRLNTSTKHQDNNNHQKLALPNMAGRVQPKRKPPNQQNHGRAARKQALDFVAGSSMTLPESCDPQIVKKFILRSLSLPNSNRDRLYKLLCQINQ